MGDPIGGYDDVEGNSGSLRPPSSIGSNGVSCGKACTTAITSTATTATPIATTTAVSGSAPATAAAAAAATAAAGVPAISAAPTGQTAVAAGESKNGVLPNGGLSSSPPIDALINTDIQTPRTDGSGFGDVSGANAAGSSSSGSGGMKKKWSLAKMFFAGGDKYSGGRNAAGTDGGAWTGQHDDSASNALSAANAKGRDPPEANGKKTASKSTSHGSASRGGPQGGAQGGAQEGAGASASDSNAPTQGFGGGMARVGGWGNARSTKALPATAARSGLTAGWGRASRDNAAAITTDAAGGDNSGFRTR